MISAGLSALGYGGHLVISLCGELDAVDAAAAEAALAEATAGSPRVVVDLAGLEFIDWSQPAAGARSRAAQPDRRAGRRSR